MARYSVAPETLRAAAGRAAGLGGDLRGLAGRVGAGMGGGADPGGDTAAALEGFTGRWGSGLVELGDSVGELGRAVGAAAALYEHTDRTQMPGGSG